MNSLKEVGSDLCCVVQAISVFLDRYKPGSTMIDLALWLLQKKTMKEQILFPYFSQQSVVYFSGFYLQFPPGELHMFNEIDIPR